MHFWPQIQENIPEPPLQPGQGRQDQPDRPDPLPQPAQGLLLPQASLCGGPGPAGSQVGQHETTEPSWTLFTPQSSHHGADGDGRERCGGRDQAGEGQQLQRPGGVSLPGGHTEATRPPAEQSLAGQGQFYLSFYISNT